MRFKIESIGLAVCLSAGVLTGLTGCAGNRYEQSTGEYIDDKAITSRVKSALNNDSQFKYPNVNVTAFKGTVQLSGFVNSSGQKSRAADLAEKVEGVKDVVNNITVKN